jgi:hypothetical protein
MRQYRQGLGKQNPVFTPELIEANLPDGLGDSKARKVELQIPQFKENPAPADLPAA